MSIMCNNTGECNIDNNGVFRTCYESASFSDEVNFCDCNNWYGWVGENCDEVSVGLVFFNLFAWISLLWSAIIIIFTARTVVYNYFLGINPTAGIDPIFYTGFFILLSATCLFISSLINVIATMNPRFFELQDYEAVFFDFEEEVTAKGGFLGIYCFIFSGLFFLYSALTIMLSWNRVVEKASRFKSTKQQEKVKRLSLFLKVIITAYTLVFIIILSFQLLLASSFMLFIAAIATTVGITFFGRSFIKTTTELHLGKSVALDLTIKLIRQSYRVYTITSTVVCLSIIIFYSTILTYQETLVLGAINYVQVLRDIGSFMTLGALTHSAHYFNTVTEGVLMVEDNTKCAKLFYFWDFKSLEFSDTSIEEEKVSVGDIERVAELL